MQRFTDYCDEPNLNVDHLRPAVKNCTDMCITMRFTNNVAGNKPSSLSHILNASTYHLPCAGFRNIGYMRGCLTDILNYNTSATGRLVARKSCESISMKQLFQRSPHTVDGAFIANAFFTKSTPIAGEALLCSCHSDFCNASASRYSSTAYSQSLSMFLSTFVLLLQRYYNLILL